MGPPIPLLLFVGFISQAYSAEFFPVFTENEIFKQPKGYNTSHNRLMN